jgi:hypothetical protein
MLQRPVSPGPGRDDGPGRAEEDWLAWCEAVEKQLGPDEDEPEDAAPWNVDIDALIAECRQVTAEEAALAARAARRGLPGGTPIADGRRGPGQPGSAITAEVAGVLAESRHAADAMLDLAHDLEVGRGFRERRAGGAGAAAGGRLRGGAADRLVGG